MGALAYTKGNDIHLGPGQEQHLPHEAWHVAQQKQGRVQATTQMKGAAINENAGLEAEADRMGEAAARVGPAPDRAALRVAGSNQGVAQRRVKLLGKEMVIRRTIPSCSTTISLRRVSLMC